MNTRIKRAIIDHALSAREVEVCGLLYYTLDSVAILRCPNIAPSPEDAFEIDSADYLKARELGVVCGIYHSHPKGTEAFSECDLETARELGLPIYVYSVLNGGWGYYTPDEYNGLIPYRPQKSVDIDTAAIYHWKNRLNGKIYIGRTRSIYRRWKDYRAYAKGSRKAKYCFVSAIRKYGLDAFEFGILEFCSSDYDIMISREEYWIAKLDATNTGYNKTSDGTGPVGVKWTEEQKERSSKARKGTGLWSEERKREMSIRQMGVNGTFFGKTHTPETRAILSMKSKGRKMPQSAIDKQKERMRAHNHMSGKSHNKKQSQLMCRVVLQKTLSGELVKEWFSVKEAIEALNSPSLYSALHLKRPHKGYIWEYKDSTPQRRMPKLKDVDAP